LQTIDYRTIIYDSPTYRFLKPLINYDFIILDFKYTDATAIILKKMGFSQTGISKRLIKVHGSFQTEDIIFGVEDRADIKRRDIFLKKAYNKNF